MLKKQFLAFLSKTWNETSAKDIKVLILQFDNCSWPDFSKSWTKKLPSLKFFVRWLTHYFGIQRPSNWQFSTHTYMHDDSQNFRYVSPLQFPWRDFIENASFWVRFGAGTAKSMLKTWLKHYHKIRVCYYKTFCMK